MLPIKPSKNLTITQAVIRDLDRGLSLMEVLEVPKRYMLSMKDLQVFASFGPKERMRTFDEVLYVTQK